MQLSASLDFYIEARRRNLDCIWSPGFMPPVLPIKCPVVITIHDLTHRLFYSFWHKIYYDMVLRKIISNADAVVTVSNFSRQEIESWCPEIADKLIVIHNGVSDSFFADNIKNEVVVDGEYILYPGNHRGYKNLEMLIAAFAGSRLPKEGIRLVFTGVANKDLLLHASKFGVEDFIIFVGVVDSNLMPSLYKNALAVVFVSKYEGFGLPILEGMAAGVPVLTSNVSAMPEVAGDSALLVNPCVKDDIVAGLNKIIFDGYFREVLIEKGLERVKKFTWENASEKYWKLFNSFVA